MKNEICSPIIVGLQAGIYTFEESDGVVDTIAFKIDLDSAYSITREDHNLELEKVQIENISFPLNDATNESSFVISIGGTKDTVRFIYEKELHFISVKCGVYYTYIITSIEHSTNYLQDIILINSQIDVVSKENIKLVF